MIDNTYPVHERFHTFQGEGVYMGQNSFFIRLFGCPVKCPWCDSAGTWHPKWVPKEVPRMTPQDLVNDAKHASAKIVVITGGEPAIHDLGPLTTALHEEGFEVHLETSGAFPIRGDIDWITLSPKRWKMPLEQNVRCADEFKFIIEKVEDVMFYYEEMKLLGYKFVRTVGGDRFDTPIWLHPEWSQRQNATILNLISNFVRNSQHFRAGYQLHRLYHVDAADNRTRPQVPLGGDPSRGV